MSVVDGSQRVLVDTFERGCPEELLCANRVPAGEGYSVKALKTEKG
jgi:hypothetical protein